MILPTPVWDVVRQVTPAVHRVFARRLPAFYRPGETARHPRRCRDRTVTVQAICKESFVSDAGSLPACSTPTADQGADMVSTAQPGWYPDPAGSGQQRWWDGYRWTVPAQPLEVTSTAEPTSAPGRGLAIGAMICGIVGLVIGLVPLFGLFALALGIVGVVLGVVGWRAGRRVGRRQGRAGIILGTLSILLGIVGMVIVSNAFDKFGDSVDCLSNARSSAQIDACS